MTNRQLQHPSVGSRSGVAVENELDESPRGMANRGPVRGVRGVVDLVKAAVDDFSEDEALTRAAALAFYSALSFAPLVVTLWWGVTAIGYGTRQAILDHVRVVLGTGPGRAVQDVLATTVAMPKIDSVAALFSVGALLFSATAVFAQLQETLNRVWGIAPSSGNVIREFFARRLVSLVMILAVGLLLVISLAVSTAVAFIFGSYGPLANMASFGASALLFSGVFGLIYKVIPDCTVQTRDALIGGALTGGLFALGKELIAVYLGRSNLGSAHGAAGSLLVLLVWTYYSAVVVLFGAELTQTYAARQGRGFGELAGLRARVLRRAPTRKNIQDDG